MSFVWVGVGGIFGALLRYEISRWMNSRLDMNFPYPTLLINISGAFLLGLFTRSLGIWFPAAHSVPTLVLGVGLCGAYTTFSTFGYETVMLFNERRQLTALIYVFASLLLGLAASGLGLYGLPTH